jgi:hypothetical protein
MNKVKEFDCVKFKEDLFKNVLKISGAKNIDEYIDYVNKEALKSPLHKVATPDR